MKTSCWFTPKPAGHVGIGISRGVPKGFRHLPVVDGDTILGIVSLRRIMGGRRPTAD